MRGERERTKSDYLEVKNGTGQGPRGSRAIVQSDRRVHRLFRQTGSRGSGLAAQAETLRGRNVDLDLQPVFNMKLYYNNKSVLDRSVNVQGEKSAREIKYLPLTTGKHAGGYTSRETDAREGHVTGALAIVLPAQFLQLAAAAQRERGFAYRRIAAAVTRDVYRCRVCKSGRTRNWSSIGRRSACPAVVVYPRRG